MICDKNRNQIKMKHDELQGEINDYISIISFLIENFITNYYLIFDKCQQYNVRSGEAILALKGKIRF